MESAGIILAAPTNLPTFWSWAWVAVALIVFAAAAAASALWSWGERRHAQRRQARSGARATNPLRRDGLPKAA